MKKILTLIAALSLVASLAVGGSIAYLQDAEQAVNTMTLGNVDIEQIEQERDANGNLVDFTQAKPAYPAVGEIAWNDNKVNINGHDYNFFGEKLKNAVDKIVTVKNTGKSDAYVRTIIAIEDPFDPAMIGINVGAVGYKQEGWHTVTINGAQYSMTTFVYTEALEPGEESLPSLLQLYLKSAATNEDCVKLGDTWDVLVVSQAVQAEGFTNAKTALDTAFGAVSATSHPWIDWDNPDDEDDQDPDLTFVSTPAELVAAFAEGGDIRLTDDIELTEALNVAAGAEVYLDMNGKTITAESGSAADPVFYTYKDSTLTITGNGKVELEDPSMSLLFPGGDVVIENGTFVRNVPDDTPANQVGALIVGAKVSPWGSQTVTINGGYFDGGYYDKNAADIDEILAGTKTLTETDDDIAKRGNSKDANAVRTAIKNNVQLTLNLSYNLFKVKGGTFVGVNPAWGDEGCMLPTTPNYLRPWSYYQGALIEGQTFNENGIVLPEGYSITKGALEDGRPTYTVNYSK